MNLTHFYKNFNMGREIDIAGTFIYNGIKNFDAINGFSEECDIFQVLYALAVGTERLQKVLLVLLEDLSDDISEEQIRDFERSLITHSHQVLHERISEKIHISFNAHQNAFLQMLTQFYESCRYDRFNISTNYQKERDLFISFLSERLHTEIRVDKAFLDTPNDNRIKRFFGKIVGTISRNYYTAIKEQSYKLGVYAYEIRYDSPAYKLFLGELKEDSFYELIFEERIALAEFFVYLLNYKCEEEIRRYISTINPLELGLNDTEVYFNQICKGKIPSALVDAVITKYEDMENSSERLKIMDDLSSSCF